MAIITSMNATIHYAMMTPAAVQNRGRFRSATAAARQGIDSQWIGDEEYAMKKLLMLAALAGGLTFFGAPETANADHSCGGAGYNYNGYGRGYGSYGGAYGGYGAGYGGAYGAGYGGFYGQGAGYPIRAYGNSNYGYANPGFRGYGTSRGYGCGSGFGRGW